MDNFFVFYSAGTDPEDEAQSFADEATVRAKSKGQTLSAQIIDINTDSPDLRYWCGTTIECVTVKANEKIGSCLNPSSLADVDALVDQLYES